MSKSILITMTITTKILRILPLLTIPLCSFCKSAPGLCAGQTQYLTVNNQRFSLAVLYSSVDAAKPTLQLSYDTGGRVVRLDSAQNCIDRFPDLMRAHGFDDKGGQPIDITLKQSLQMTTGATFDGKKLLAWLTQTEAEYKAQKMKFMIKIQLGVYDRPYLDTYQPGDNSNANLNGRIGVFLIPYDGNTATMPANRAANTSTSPSGGSGYDLGGLQP